MLLLSNNRRSHQGLAPFAATCSEIEQARTNSFHGNNLLNCISSSMVCKIFFFAPNLPVFRKSLDKGKTNSKAIARRYDIYTLRKSIIRNNDLCMSF